MKHSLLLLSILSIPVHAADGIGGTVNLDTNVTNARVVQLNVDAGALRAGALSLGGPSQVVIGGVAVDGGQIKGDVTVRSKVNNATVVVSGGQVVVGGVGVRGR